MIMYRGRNSQARLDLQASHVSFSFQFDPATSLRSAEQVSLPIPFSIPFWPVPFRQETFHPKPTFFLDPYSVLANSMFKGKSFVLPAMPSIGINPQVKERRQIMGTYITLIRYTKQGIEKIKEAPARLDAAKQAFRAMGAELKEFYLVLGQYDAIVIAEGPDDETVAKLALAIASQGAIRTETFRAFPEKECRKIFESLP